MKSKPKLHAELEFLDALESGEPVTQMTLSKRIGVAVGLVNGLLKRATQKGFIKVKSTPSRRYAYFLTPKGFAEKARLVAEYMEDSLLFFRVARRQCAEVLGEAAARGHRRVALVGSGELAEIAVLAAHDVDHIELVCVVDRQTNRERLCGLKVVRSLAELDGIDALLVTDSRAPQATFDTLSTQYLNDTVLTLPLQRIRRPLNGGGTAGSDQCM